MTAKQRKVTATHGTCKLTAFVGTMTEALDSSDASLVIRPERGESAAYDVLRLRDRDGAILGFRLVKRTRFIVDRKTYDIDTTRGYGWQCDCPSAEFSGAECKHVRALRQCLARCGQLPPAPQAQTFNDTLEDL